MANHWRGLQPGKKTDPEIRRRGFCSATPKSVQAQWRPSSVQVQSLLGYSPESNGEQLFPGLPDPGQEGCQLLPTHNTECPETLQSRHLVDRAVGKGRHRRRQARRPGEVLGEDSTPSLAFKGSSSPTPQVFVTLHQRADSEP